MKKIATLLFFLISFSIYTQTDSTKVYQTPKFWDNVRFGGGFGLGFGSNNTTIAITPSAVYQFNDMFAIGPGVSYLYAKRGDFKSNVFGVGLVSLFNPTEEFQLSAEFEQLYVNQKLAGFQDLNYNYPSLYLGAAYRFGAFAAGLRYDVLYDDTKSIYASAFSPIVRFYF